MKKSLIALALLTPVLAMAGEIETTEVNYAAGKVTAKGFLAVPKEEGPHPGVLVVHEWWGNNDYPRQRARMLAEQGYAALAVDLYGEGKTTEHPRDATAFMAEVQNNRPELNARFRAAMKFLQANPAVDREKIAAIGYGFGGNVVLQMARNGTVGLDGVASFHGTFGLREPNPPISKLKAKILVCHGAEDPYIKDEEVEAFQAKMKEVKANMKFVSYKEAMRGFTNPKASVYGEKFQIPLVYNKEADQASWGELTNFLADLWDDEEDE